MPEATCSPVSIPPVRTRFPARPRFLVKPQLLTRICAPPLGGHSSIRPLSCGLIHGWRSCRRSWVKVAGTRRPADPLTWAGVAAGNMLSQ
jgi:hypothetical protein